MLQEYAQHGTEKRGCIAHTERLSDNPVWQQPVNSFDKGYERGASGVNDKEIVKE